jgi:hypothetical protein
MFLSSLYPPEPCCPSIRHLIKAKYKKTREKQNFFHEKQVIIQRKPLQMIRKNSESFYNTLETSLKKMGCISLVNIKFIS